VPIQYPDVYKDKEDAVSEAGEMKFDWGVLLDAAVAASRDASDLGQHVLVLAHLAKLPSAPKTKTELSLWVSDMNTTAAHRKWKRIIQCFQALDKHL
jgi:hypothetical protein